MAEIIVEKIPVNLKYRNPRTQANDHLLPTTRADLIEESVDKQFISRNQKERIDQKQDRLGFTPLNKAGDSMTGPLMLSGEPVTQNQQAATKQYVDSKVASIVNSAPQALDTLNELAAAINNDPNFAVSVSTMTGQKLNKTDAAVVPTANKLIYLDANGKLPAEALATAVTPTAGDSSTKIATTAFVANAMSNIDLLLTEITANQVEQIFRTIVSATPESAPEDANGVLF